MTLLHREAAMAEFDDCVVSLSVRGGDIVYAALSVGPKFIFNTTKDES